jgi:hypothetical protein
MEYVQWRQSLIASTSASDKIVRHEKLNIRNIISPSKCNRPKCSRYLSSILHCNE